MPAVVVSADVSRRSKRPVPTRDRPDGSREHREVATIAVGGARGGVAPSWIIPGGETIGDLLQPLGAARRKTPENRNSGSTPSA
jgi:hypothetical protein